MDAHFDFGTGMTTYMFLTANSNAGTSRFGITTAGNGQEQQLNAPTVTTGSWQHVAVTRTGNTGTLYVNGVQVAQNTTMTLSPDEPLEAPRRTGSGVPSSRSIPT